MMNPSASSIFLVQLVCLLVFLPTSQCSSQTPDYDICLYLLKYNGGSGIYSANRTRLADVMIDVVGLRAKDAHNKVTELLHQRAREDRPLMICSAHYAYIISTIVPNAKRDAYTNPQAAGKWMRLIPDTVEKGCEDASRGSSPLTDYNIGVEKVAAIAEAIIGQLG
ncbi:hypothetical protein ACLB2K_019480 [Fragaria x ananassa]